MKGKREKQRYTHLNEEFQRIGRRDKKAFLSDQCKWLVPSSSLGGFCANTTLLRCPFLRESLSVSSSGKVASSQSLWEPESCVNFATSSFIMIRNEIICVLFTVYPNRGSSYEDWPLSISSHIPNIPKTYKSACHIGHV